MDIGARGGDFNYLSGVYQMYLIVGDASISNSFQWLVADIELKFPAASKTGTVKYSQSTPLSKIKYMYINIRRREKTSHTIAITRNRTSVPRSRKTPVSHRF